jgi:hypothetical protein
MSARVWTYVHLESPLDLTVRPGIGDPDNRMATIELNDPASTLLIIRDVDAALAVEAAARDAVELFYTDARAAADDADADVTP